MPDKLRPLLNSVVDITSGSISGSAQGAASGNSSGGGLTVVAVFQKVIQNDVLRGVTV